MLPVASSCPPPCLCYSDGSVDCRGRGLLSLPPLQLLPPGTLSLLLANNNLASLGASAFANLSSLEVRFSTQIKFTFHPELTEVLRYNKQLIFSCVSLSYVSVFNANVQIKQSFCVHLGTGPLQ